MSIRTKTPYHKPKMIGAKMRCETCGDAIYRVRPGMAGSYLRHLPGTFWEDDSVRLR